MGTIKIGVLRKQATTAVDELEQLVAERIHANPAQTRATIVSLIFSERPELYDRYLRETTVSRHGESLTAMYDRVQVHGISKCAESVDEEVARRVEELMAKTAGATREQATAFLFREDPVLYERWRRESYA